MSHPNDPPDSTIPAAPTPEQLRSTPPVLADDDRWESEATEAQHKGLASVRATADAWSRSIGAILGGFALVAFIKGPEAIKDVPTGIGAAFNLGYGFGSIDPARTVILLIFIAAALVILAVFAAALAAQGSPTWTKVLDGPRLRTQSETAAKRAIKLLWASRILTLIGATLVFCAMALAWMATIDKLSTSKPKGQAAIVSTPNAVVCGELRSRADGSIEVVPSPGAASVISPSTAVTLVESCPAKP